MIGTTVAAAGEVAFAAELKGLGQVPYIGLDNAWDIKPGTPNPRWPGLLPRVDVRLPPLSGADETLKEIIKGALDKQIGGDHYKKMAIQPMTYSMKNGLDACQHTIIKYVTRFRDKGGIEDLRKAIHCIEMLIEFEKEAKNVAA